MQALRLYRCLDKEFSLDAECLEDDVRGFPYIVIMTARRIPLAAAAGLVLLMSACSSAGSEAAQVAYDACYNEDTELDLLVLDGSEVRVEVTGDDARARSGTDDELDALEAGRDDVGMDGFAVALRMLMDVECLVEETTYPGSAEQLTDGDEWDGWRYAEDDGAGSEVTFSFTSTQ